MKLFFSSKPWRIASLLIAVFLLGAAMGYISNGVLPNEDKRFEEYTETIFKEEVGSNTLNLHYTLAHPEKYHIPASAVTLGEISWGDTSIYTALENYETALREFSYERLSEDNQLTYDMLLLYFHTLKEGENYELLEEILSPSLGIQAQLPILLAEYTFYDAQDIEDYISLLEDVKPYFQRIMDFEREKAKQGYFMTDTALDGILQQCGTFVEEPENNYLLGIFQDKLKEADFLTEEQRESYIEKNKERILQYVIPAYENLIQELESLRGSGKNKEGLCHYPQGQNYYRYLLKTQVGVYEKPDEIRQRLYQQLVADYGELGKLVNENPSLVASVYKNDYTIGKPEDVLEELKEDATQDFPVLEVSDYEVKYVHESLEAYLSPAFYLTPPVDTLSPNAIYINQGDSSTGIELFATLAHEGFPGHLYQTQFFGQSNPSNVRYLPSFGGYVEGWATYIESYAYGYADADENLTRLMWLNRSINLCLYSMVDMGVHYYGWSLDNVKHYLGNFGITNSTVIEEIYQAILENPANYLRYYLGYLNFNDLKEECQSMEGEAFNLQEFHKKILEIGPVQFPVLRKHLGLTLQ